MPARTCMVSQGAKVFVNVYVYVGNRFGKRVSQRVWVCLRVGNQAGNRVGL
jgi:hypothetical protein